MENALSILIVDDTAWQLQKYKMYVEKLGHKVITATDGNSAARIVVDYPKDVDAVICDVQMSPQDGLFFIQYIDRSLKTPPPVLLHSSDALYRHPTFKEPFELAQISRDHKFVEFRVKDDHNLYIKAFLERVATTIA